MSASPLVHHQVFPRNLQHSVNAIPATLCTNGWFSRRVAALNFTLTQYFPRCENMQRENQIGLQPDIDPISRSHGERVFARCAAEVVLSR